MESTGGPWTVNLSTSRYLTWSMDVLGHPWNSK
jgi:hypothetical protein